MAKLRNAPKRAGEDFTPQNLSNQRQWADEKFVSLKYGLTRTPLYNLRKSGAIRSVAVRQPGATFGKRLFHIGSVEAFLADCERRELETTEAAAIVGANQ